MNTAASIYKTLKEKGFRLTKARKAILAIFLESSAPLTATDLLVHLKKRKIAINKTTAYRELFFLKTQNFIREIIFGDGKTRYEMDKEHHHHLVCVECNDVRDVELQNTLCTEQQLLEKTTQFKIINHSLEFFGICKRCRA